MVRRRGGLEGEVIRGIRGIRGIRERRGKERYSTGSQGKGSSFLDWFARVRKYFVCNEKFRSEILRFQEGIRVLRVLKLEGFNLKVKLKLKCLKDVPKGGVPEGRVVFDRFLRVRDRRFGQGLLWWFVEGTKERLIAALVVCRGFGERAIEGRSLWCFAEGVRPCNGAILIVALVVRKGCEGAIEGCSGGSQRVFGLAKERLRGYSGGLQGSGVRNLAKEQF
jgi:hypothetical protein